MPTSDYTPSLADVAAEIPTRTRDGSGSEVDTFTADTEPTADNVVKLIQKAVDDVESEFGPDLPTQNVAGQAVDFTDRVRQLVALGAAIKVERTYFPEQVARNTSPYAQMLQEWKDQFARLQRQIEAATGGEGDTGGQPGPRAQYNFPDGANWLGARF